MNIFTDKGQFTESPEYIFDNCSLLLKEACIVHNDILYEKLDNQGLYRFFFNCDDYDYLTNDDVIEELNKLFEEQ